MLVPKTKVVKYGRTDDKKSKWTEKDSLRKTGGVDDIIVRIPTCDDFLRGISF